jgi:hypothetical protein
VTLRAREIELVVERSASSDGTGERVRLSARFEVTEGADGPSHQELAQALDRLRADLDALVGAPLAAAPALRPDRDLPELVDTYRPRQRELIDLLREEGDLTENEHQRLLEYLVASRSVPAAPPLPPPMVEAPLAAAPVVAERLPDRARAVPELLRTFQIESLRQAGAVRARRQISFEEYMALKRHFESMAPGSETKSPERTPAP